MDLKKELEENVNYLKGYVSKNGYSNLEFLKIAIEMQRNRILTEAFMVDVKVGYENPVALEQIAMNLKYIAENGAQ